MQPCRGCDPGSNPGRGATNSRLPTNFLLPFPLPWKNVQILLYSETWRGYHSLVQPSKNEYVSSKRKSILSMCRGIRLSLSQTSEQKQDGFASQPFVAPLPQPFHGFAHL